MAGREGGPGGAAAAGTPEGGANSGAGGAAPQPGTGTPGAGTAGTPTPAVDAIPVEMLPAELQELVRGRSGAERRQIMNNLVSAAKRAARSADPPAAPAKPEPPKPEPKNEKPVEERILEDAEGTIADIIERRYGPRIANMESAVNKNVYATLRNEYDDFEEYEDDVKEVLREAGAPVTQETAFSAYTMLVGQKQLEERRRLRAMENNPERAHEQPPTPAARQFTELEKEIAAAHRRTPEDYWSDDGMEIKVPTGPKKEASNA